METKKEETFELIGLTKEEKQLLERIEKCLADDDTLTDQEDLDMLYLPEDVWESHVLPYLERNAICGEAEVKLLNLPTDKVVRLLSAYLKGDDEYYLGYEAQDIYDQLPEEVKGKIRENIAENTL